MKKVFIASILSSTVVACDPGSQVTQRDVYHNLEDCVADWGDVELCQKTLSDAEAKAKQASSNGSTSAFVFFGPSYMGSDRYVSHNGQVYAPSTTRAASTANFTGSSITPSSFSAPRAATSSITPKPSAVTTTRGGFGSTGSASSGGS